MMPLEKSDSRNTFTITPNTSSGYTISPLSISGDANDAKQAARKLNIWSKRNISHK